MADAEPRTPAQMRPRDAGTLPARRPTSIASMDDLRSQIEGATMDGAKTLAVRGTSSSPRKRRTSWSSTLRKHRSASQTHMSADDMSLPSAKHSPPTSSVGPVDYGVPPPRSMTGLVSPVSTIGSPGPLTRVFSAGAAPGAHTQQPSISSSSDFNLNQMWKSDEKWEVEASALESEIEELNLSYSKGQLRAFGHSATTVYDELDKMRREQFELFERHVAFEADFLTDLGGAEASGANVDSKGFDRDAPDESEAAAAEANSLLVAMNGVCKSIQSFTTSTNTSTIKKQQDERGSGAAEGRKAGGARRRTRPDGRRF